MNYLKASARVSYSIDDCTSSDSRAVDASLRGRKLLIAHIKYIELKVASAICHSANFTGEMHNSRAEIIKYLVCFICEILLYFKNKKI